MCAALNAATEEKGKREGEKGDRRNVESNVEGVANCSRQKEKKIYYEKEKKKKKERENALLED